jgi:hypothetical protein
MELSPSWEAASFAATQEIPNNLWNPKIHYLVHKSLPLLQILRKNNPVHITYPITLRTVLILSTNLRLGLPSSLFPPGFLRSMYQILCQFLYLRLVIQRIHPGPRAFVTFRNKLIIYGDELWAPTLTPKLEDRPLSALRHCLFNTFVATPHIWRPSPPSATWGCAMPWWQGTHLTWALK